jgi:RNA polymerase primary sigma factor
MSSVRLALANVRSREGTSMRTTRPTGNPDGSTNLDHPATQVLDVREERQLLRALSECKRKLAEALARIEGAEDVPDADDPQALAAFIATFYEGDGRAEARLGAIFRRYSELRGKLALANMRLVAHVAKRFRDRGISYPDLLQEGFCGLLEAIDRFDVSHGTKLATYAMWWIRQSMQKAVAAGAYPVRLSPRHLRQLARSQDEIERGHRPATGQDGPTRAGDGLGSAEMIHCIHAATRPSVSLDAKVSSEVNFSLIQAVSDPDGDRTEEVDRDEAIGKLMQGLRPREKEVLSLRYGLGGRPRMSLSQVGKVLEVSKERVRQIQDQALEKLRAAASTGDGSWGLEDG